MPGPFVFPRSRSKSSRTVLRNIRQNRCMRYLSLEWIEAMQSLVGASESMQAAAQTHEIGITQVVTDGPEGTVMYHLQVGNGVATFGAGPASVEHVRMEQSWETAVAVATEQVAAQEVFIKGHVRIGGDSQRIMDSLPVFAALDAAFASVRSETVYE